MAPQRYGKRLHWERSRIHSLFAAPWMLQIAASATWPRRAIARPAFTQELAKTSVDLVVVTPAELGFKEASVPLRDIYARSEKFGLNLAPAEVGPELRLQYFDQPVGEFLHVGMKAIATWSGDPVILVVANGGAGLILIDQSARSDIQWPSNAVFLFVRQHATPNIAKAHMPESR